MIRISDTDFGFLIRIADCGLRIADWGARGPGAGQGRFPADSPWETAPPLGQAQTGPHRVSFNFQDFRMEGMQFRR
jgi:hypothetical protein